KGLIVGVVEKGPEIGGSALLSGGGVIRPLDREVVARANASGKAYFADLLVDGFDDLTAWIASLDVQITEPASVEEVVGIPSSLRGLDVVQYIALCRVGVLHAGGWVVVESEVERLLVEDNAVIGAEVRDWGGVTPVYTDAVLLATGGFQGSPELRCRHLG